MERAPPPPPQIVNCIELLLNQNFLHGNYREQRKNFLFSEFSCHLWTKFLLYGKTDYVLTITTWFVPVSLLGTFTTLFTNTFIMFCTHFIYASKMCKVFTWIMFILHIMLQAQHSPRHSWKYSAVFPNPKCRCKTFNLYCKSVFFSKSTDTHFRGH